MEAQPSMLVSGGEAAGGRSGAEPPVSVSGGVRPSHSGRGPLCRPAGGGRRRRPLPGRGALCARAVDIQLASMAPSSPERQ